MRIIFLVFIATATVAATLQAQRAADPASQARKALDLLLGERYADLFAMFTPQMQAALSEETLRAQVGPQVKSFGEVKKTGEPSVQKAGQNDIVVIAVEFAAANVNFQCAIDGDGKIAGMFLRPAPRAAVEWKSPPYSKPGAFRDREIAVGDAQWKLPGTLSIPTGKGPFPAVVLVHGSGPSDRDESVGGVKVFRDLAEGLASRGVAVLRYEKRTKAYAARLTGDALRTFTVAEETVDDAISAVAAARAQPEVDPARVFVLGHSLGGYLAPRIARRDPKLAGLIVLSGSVRPLEDLIVEQSEYLGVPADRLEVLKTQAAAVKHLDANGPETLLGMPRSYLLDLKDYDAAREAAALRTRILVLQGERDYQVTMKDFGLWKAALDGHAGVTLRSYPSLNHLLVAGEGKGAAEYEKPGHVAFEVVDAIGDWIHPV